MAADKAPAYQWYPKDYLTDPAVACMSLEAEGAYRRLLDYCWLEGSLPDDLSRLAPLCKAKSATHMARLWAEIAGKFSRVTDEAGENRLVHKRLEAERVKQADFSALSAAGGRASAAARRRKFGSADPRTNREPTVNRPVHIPVEPNVNSSSPSPTPVGTENGADAPVPVVPGPSEFMLRWNELTSPPIAKCLALTTKRSRAIRQRLAERPWPEWDAVFTRIAASRFCRGENDRGWVASIDWVLRPDTATKVLEGAYDNRATGPVDPALARKLGPANGTGWSCDHQPACLSRQAHEQAVILAQRRTA